MATSNNVPPRAWQRMLSGRRLDLLDPSPLDIEIEDIAHGLARIARWNGQTVGEHTFSVAQHSLLVDDICCALKKDVTARMRLAALLHDAAEYVIGDLISPFKAAIGNNYKAVEARLSTAIHVRFSLPAQLPTNQSALIKKADKIAAFFEATRLAGFDEEEAFKFFGKPSALGADTAKFTQLRAVSTRRAQTDYLDRFHVLQAEVEKAA